MNNSIVTKKRKRKIKRWQKWLIVIIAALIIIASAFAAYIYFYLKSISLDDIALRHTDSVENSEVDVEEEPPKVPAAIKKPVEKASDLIGGKEIDSQDAIDIAAILLNSGLSLKEISYLQGNASYDLTTEEKQKIRDLLLAKLSEEEIALLRSITTKYGKGLNIVNPDYPIEWVGETDPDQIKKNEAAWTKMQADKKDQATDKTVPVTGKDQTQGSDNAPAASTELSDKQKQVKQTIDSKYIAQMDALYATCKAQSNSLVKQIAAEIKASDEVSIESIQEQFLAQVVSAEATCDTQFQQIVSKAKSEYKQAGIGENHLPSWNAQYEKAKADARAGALQVIAGSLN